MTKLILSTLILAPVFAFAAPHNISASGGGVEVVAIGKPSFIKIRGKGAAPTGTFTVEGKKATGVIEFELASLDTGIELRNEHMLNKYLEVKQHPKAKLQIEDLTLPKDWTPEQAKLDGVPFKGKLTLHGETQPVEGTFTVGDKRDVNAEFKLKLSDYKITIPEYLGVKVADEVNVTVSINELKPAIKSADVK